MTEYDAIHDYEESCAYGTAKMRERRVREGFYAPRTGDETELRWASEGPRQRLNPMVLMTTGDAQKEERPPNPGELEGPILRRDRADTQYVYRFASEIKPAVGSENPGYKSPGIVTHRTGGPHKE